MVEAKVYKINILCPRCEKPGVRLHVEDGLIPSSIVMCVECEQKLSRIDIHVLAGVVSGIVEKVVEETDANVELDKLEHWIQHFIEERMGLS